MEDEYWHLGARGEGHGGPFETYEAAVADALVVLQDSKGYGPPPNLKIVKVVATSFTEVIHNTTWTRHED
jgi:hypothetical protein